MFRERARAARGFSQLCKRNINQSFKVRLKKRRYVFSFLEALYYLEPLGGPHRIKQKQETSNHSNMTIYLYSGHKRSKYHFQFNPSNI